MAGWQGEDLDAYGEFKDIEVIVANASKCQLVDVISSTMITCDLPHSDDKLLNLLNDDGDASVQVIKLSLRCRLLCCMCDASTDVIEVYCV